MNQNLAYVPCGDYVIPDIKLSQTESHTLGKYGRMRRIFLEQNKPMLFPVIRYWKNRNVKCHLESY